MPGAGRRAPEAGGRRQAGRETSENSGQTSSAAGPSSSRLRCTAIVCVATYLIFRLSGKGEIAQLNPAGFVLLLIVGGLTAAMTLVTASATIKTVERHDTRLDWLLEGKPAELIREGDVNEEGLRKARMDRDDVDRALRRNGALDPNEVRLAMFETDGSICVVGGR